MRHKGIAALVCLSWLSSCSGAETKAELKVDGQPARILLWPAFPPDVGEGSEWQDAFMDDLESTARKNGFAPLTPAALAASDDPSQREALGSCRNAGCADDVARAARANLVLTRTWEASGPNCVYYLTVRDLAGERELVQERGEERRGCTDEGLARPCLIAARMALQQAAQTLRREAEAASNRGDDDVADGVGGMEQFIGSLDNMIETLRSCHVAPDLGPDARRSIELNLEFDEFGKLKMWIEGGPDVPFKAKECIDARVGRFPYPAFPEGGDAVYKTFKLHLVAEGE